MKFRGLDALRAFVETGSVAKAADRLLRTAPQVSRILSTLEDEVGFKIFTREGRNLILTEEGKEFYRHAAQVVDARDDLLRHANVLKSGHNKTLRIIAAPIVTHALINTALSRFLSENPDINVRLDARVRLDLETWVGKEDFDFGIVFLPLKTESFDIRPLLKARAILVVHRSHELAGQDVITFEQLVEHDIITMDKRSSLRTQLEALAAQTGRTLKIRVEAPNGVVACQLANANVGCCLADPFVARSSGMTDIVLRRFEPSIPIRYGLIFPKWTARTQIVENLAAEIIRYGKMQVAEDWMAPARN